MSESNTNYQPPQEIVGRLDALLGDQWTYDVGPDGPHGSAEFAELKVFARHIAPSWWMARRFPLPASREFMRGVWADFAKDIGANLPRPEPEPSAGPPRDVRATFTRLFGERGWTATHASEPDGALTLSLRVVVPGTPVRGMCARIEPHELQSRLAIEGEWRQLAQHAVDSTPPKFSELPGTSNARAAYGEPEPCNVPPPGWQCSRAKGHDGPCAARPLIVTSPRAPVTASPQPTKLERDLADALGCILQDSRADGSTVALEEHAARYIAGALAAHRNRLGELVTAATNTLGADAKFTTYTLVKMKSEGWTPLQVREVIDDYQKLRQDMIEVRELVRRIFAGAP